MGLYCVDQSMHMLRRGKLADAMAQIENMARADGGCVSMRPAKTVQGVPDFSCDLFGVGEQHIGVQVALQGLTWLT